MEEYFNTPAAECTKNPGHEQFIRTASFLPTNLPERFRSQLVWSLIYHKARLTVRLIVNSVSRARPLLFQRAFSDSNTGSGYVTHIGRTNSEEVTITIDTAAHVVFDNAEAEKAVAKFYFVSNREMFQLRHARLVRQNLRKDVSKIIFTVDRETVRRLAGEFAGLEYALSPSVIFDVNNNVKISLLNSAVVRYKILSLPWLSFLFSEIKCVKNIKFASNVIRSFQLEIKISLTLLYDVILLIIAVALNRDHLLGRIESIGECYWNVINMEMAQRPYITFKKEKEINYGNNDNSTSKLPLSSFIEMDNQPISMVNGDFTIQNERLYRLMTCFIRSPIEIVGLNEALTDFCQFDISARFKRSDCIVIEIPVTSVSVPNRMSLEVNLHDIRVEEEHDHIAVMVSHPHDMPQQITEGKLEDSRPGRITYSTPSCPGSSGGPVFLIPKEPTSLNDLENIGVFTHSYVSLDSGRGIGNRF